MGLLKFWTEGPSGSFAQLANMIDVPAAEANGAPIAATALADATRTVGAPYTIPVKSDHHRRGITAFEVMSFRMRGAKTAPQVCKCCGTVAMVVNAVDATQELIPLRFHEEVQREDAVTKPGRSLGDRRKLCLGRRLDRRWSLLRIEASSLRVLGGRPGCLKLRIFDASHEPG